MKRLAFVIVVAALVWSAHWVWASGQKRAAVEGWLEDRRAAGWDVSHDGLDVTGFPNRVDLTLNNLSMRDPGGTGWDLPFLQVLTLSYSNGHEIVVFPDSLTVTTPGATWQMTSQGARASIVHDGPTVERMNFEAEVLNLERTAGAGVALAGVNAALLREGPATYRATLQADALARGGRVVSGNAVPEALDGFRADTTWRFDRPWRLDAAPDRRPQPEYMKLRLVEYVFGQLELKLAGETDVDDQGRLTGEVTLKAVNWREMLDMARDAGHVPPGMADALGDGLGLIAGLSGNRDTLDLPLQFRSGLMSLGPVPLGEAPRLRLP